MFRGSDCKESACNAGNPGLILGFRRSLGEGNGKLLQYSCLEISMDRGAWWATVHWVAKSLYSETNRIYSLITFFLNIFLMWTIFKDFIIFITFLKTLLYSITVLLLLYVLCFWLWGMWDLSYPIRDQTWTPCTGRQNLNHWTTREVPVWLLLTNTDTHVTHIGSRWRASPSLHVPFQSTLTP